MQFIANYERELRIGANIRRKGKVEKVCRENEKSLEGNKNGIKKNTGRNEKTSR